MNNMILSFVAFAAVVFGTSAAVGCSGSSGGDKKSDSQDDTASRRYGNPVSRRSLPDPTVIRDDDGSFYLYATEDIGHIPICRSENLTDWSVTGRAFTENTRPTFEANGGLWAPDINRIGGQWVLYYSMSVWGGGATCGIGVATSDSPMGPFTDRGKLFRSNEIGVHNSIDPFFIDDGGVKYLFWGSWYGIWGVELSDDGLALAAEIFDETGNWNFEKAAAGKRQIAGGAFEAAYIHRRGGHYYLFASVGSCCEGVNSTYRLVVGRSSSLFGPYVDRQGRDMMDNAFEVVIDKNSRFVGNGHCSEIVTDDAGSDWILYHGVDLDAPSGRVLMLDRVTWDTDGWPHISDGTPSLSADKPVFK